MSFSFCETVKGHELADTLIRELPGLSEGINQNDNEEILEILSKMHQSNIDFMNQILEQMHTLAVAHTVKKQYAVTDRSNIIGNIISNEINDGARLIGVYDSGYKDSAPQSTAVFEKVI